MQEINSKLAFVFPGQGSQSVGMLANMAASYPEVEQTFELASSVLGYDLWGLVQNGPESELGKTEKTQPALLVAGVALWKIWQKNGPCVPAALAGHSLGEYTALVCAEALDFSDAVALVKKRGEMMQSAVAPGVGAMAAILGLDDKTVIDLCQKTALSGIVSAVNFNSPGQVVIAGESLLVEKVMHEAKEAGAKRAIKLAVSVPSHCQLMKPAAENLEAALADITIKKPKFDVINNVSVTAESDGTKIKEALVRQLYNPVRWVETIEKMSEAGIEVVVECGPGKVLSGLNKRTVRQLKVAGTDEPEALEKIFLDLANK